MCRLFLSPIFTSLLHYPPPSLTIHEYLTHDGGADTCADLIILILDLHLNVPELYKSRRGQSKRQRGYSFIGGNITKACVDLVIMSSFLLPFSHFTVEAHLTLPHLSSQWGQRSYGTLCTHKCCASERARLERSGFSQRTGHADLSSSRKYTRPCGIRCPVFSSNGKLDDRCSRGTRWIFQPSFPWNNIADRVELETRRKAVMPKKRPDTIRPSCVDHNFTLCLCVSVPAVADLLSFITVICRDPASRKLG